MQHPLPPIALCPLCPNYAGKCTRYQDFADCPIGRLPSVSPGGAGLCIPVGLDKTTIQKIMEQMYGANQT